MVLPHTHKRDQETGQLGGPRPMQQQAAANDPWGDNNYAAHPPQKPYGATSPPRPDMSPGSYGPLAGPDPVDWGEIEETGLQQPLSNEAVRHGSALASPQDRVVAPTYQSPPSRDLDYPAIADWQESSSAYPYAAQSNTAGPSTPMEARDPNGIRMEEALDQAAQDYVRHLTEVHGQPYYEGMHMDPEKHLIDHGDVVEMRHQQQPLPEGYHDHPYIETEHEYRHGRARWPDASSSHSFTASEERELPDPYLMDGEQHHHPECTCRTCEYDRYHAKHLFEGAMAAALAELKDGPEPALPETTADEPMALDPQATGGGPGMSTHDESLTPDDYSIQSMGTQQAGEAEDSTGDLAFSVSPQSGDPVGDFQATAAARQYAGEGPVQGDADIAAAAREYLSKTADVLPKDEADALIREGRGERARNLDLLQLEGTHYEDSDDHDDELALI